jgi:flagellar biosynthesis/type III secretory pathway protein FliH
MTRKNKLERAGEIGVSMPTLKSWERSGVDIWSDDDVRKKLGRMRNMPPHLKPEFQPKASAPITPPGDDPTQIDIETIISQLSAATDKHQAQTVKIQIDGLLNAYKLREAAGKYVAKAKVDEDLLRIGAAVKSAMKRMEADLPQMLEGMTASKIQTVIRDKVDEVLAMLADKTAEVWTISDV